MARNVKKARERRSVPTAAIGRRLVHPSTEAPVARSRISSKHQVTIAKDAFTAAGLHAGDVVMVRAVGPGRVELTRLEELFAKHRGRVKGGGGAREAVEQLRDEWL